MKESLASLNVNKETLVDSIIRTEKTLDRLEIGHPERDNLILVFVTLTDHYEDRYGWDELVTVLPSLVAD
jgi:hypothetical protein